MNAVCWWVWNGIAWASDPQRPHACPLGYACEAPDGTPGAFIGERKSTECVLAP